MTISDAEESVQRMDEASIETADKNRSWLTIPAENKFFVFVAAILIANAFISYYIATSLFEKADDMTRIGWEAQPVNFNGTTKDIYVPIYIKSKDYKEINKK